MEQKCYSKQELALEYFPDATPEVASAHLRRWINRCKPLHDVLVKSGYTKWSKEFSPIQVAHIFDYLGEPYEENHPSGLIFRKRRENQ